MKFTLILSCLILLLSATNAMSEKPLNTSITIYNNNIGVVREAREMELSKGIGTAMAEDVPEAIIPESVKIKFDGRVLEQNYRFDLANFNSILNRYIGKEITITGKETYFGKLIAVSGDNLTLQKKEGGLILLPSIKDYQLSLPSLPDEMTIKPTLVWKINANNAGKQNVDLSYITRQISWRAEYVAVLNENEDKMDLNSWVSIDNNSGATFSDCSLKLVAGDINFDQSSKNRYSPKRMMSGTMAMMEDSYEFSEEALSDFHLYRLDAKTELMNKETKQISLFEAADIKVVKKYKLQHSLGNSLRSNIYSHIEFLNSKDNKLGIPLPAGNFKIFKTQGKDTELLGASNIAHTPRDEKIDIVIGSAFDLLAEEKLVASFQVSKNVSENEYQVIIKNRKNEAAQVEVTSNLGTNCEILSSNYKYEKLNAGAYKFVVPAKANGETPLNFKVRYVYNR